jgi:malonyl CoA-acyl carrier protein transacylase
VFSGEACDGESGPPLALCFLEARFGRFNGLAEFWNALLGEHPLTPTDASLDLAQLSATPLRQLQGRLGNAAVDLVVCDGSAPGPALRRQDLEQKIASPSGIALTVWSHGGAPKSADQALAVARGRLAAGADCVLLAAAEFDRGVVIGLLPLPIALAKRCAIYAVLDGAADGGPAPVTIGTLRRPDPLAGDETAEPVDASAWHWRAERYFFVSQGFSSLIPLLVGAMVLSERVIPPCTAPRARGRVPLPTPFLLDQGTPPLRIDVLLYGGMVGAPVRLRSVVEPDAVAPDRCTAWPAEPFIFSARSKPALLAKIERALADLERTNDALSMTTLARSLRSDAGAFRVGFLARDRQECIDRLRHAAARIGGSKRRAHFERFGFHCALPEAPDASDAPASAAMGVAFMAPGIGSAYPGVLQGQAVYFPLVRERLDRFAQQGHPQAAHLGEKLYRDGDHYATFWSDLDWSGAIGSIVALALEPLMERLGLTPDVRLGFSNGEMAALLAAEALKPAGARPLEALIWDSVDSGQTRARHASLQTGRMVAVHLITGGRELLSGQLRHHQGRVFMAIDASSSHVVLFGLEPDIEQVVDALSEAGHICLPMPIDRPFHTALIESELESLETLLSGLDRGGGRVPVWSCARNVRYPKDSVQVTEVIRESITRTVRFREALQTLRRDGISAFIEIGANAQLSGYARDTLKGQGVHIAALDRHGANGALQVLDTALYLFTHGFGVDIDALGPDRAERIDPGHVGERPTTPPQTTPDLAEQTAQQLPISPKSEPYARHLDRGQRLAMLTESLATTRSFIASQERVMLALIAHARRNRQSALVAASTHRTDLFAQARPLGGGAETECALVFQASLDEHLDHHRLGRVPDEDRRRPERPLAVLAMVMTLEFMVQACARHLARSQPDLEFVGVDDLSGSRWVTALPECKRVKLRVSRTRGASDPEIGLETRLIDSADGGPGDELEAAIGRVVFGRVQPLAAFELEGAELATPWTAEDFNRFALFHGPAYQCLSELKALRNDGVEFAAQVPDQRGLVHGLGAAHWLTPATLLDAVPQAVAFWLTARGLSWFTAFPVSISRYRQASPLPVAGETVSCRARIRLHGDTLIADACLIDASGRVFARIDGIKIVVYRMHQPLLARLYWREAAALLTTQAAADPLRREMVRECPPELDADLRLGGGIFAMALAQVVLTAAEQAAWLRMPASGDRRSRALKVRLLAKEAVIAWYREYGASSPDYLDFSVADGVEGGRMTNLRCEPLLGMPSGQDRPLQVTVVDADGRMRATARPG